MWQLFNWHHDCILWKLNISCWGFFHNYLATVCCRCCCVCRIRNMNTLLSNPPSLSARQMQVKGSPSKAPNYLLQPSLHQCNSHYSHSPWPNPNPLPSIMHQFIYKVYCYSTHPLMNLRFQESIQTSDRRYV